MKRMTKSVGVDKSHISDKFAPHPYLFSLYFLFRSGGSCLWCLLWPPPPLDARCLSLTDAVLTHCPPSSLPVSPTQTNPTEILAHTCLTRTYMLYFFFSISFIPFNLLCNLHFYFHCCYDLFATTYK